MITENLNQKSTADLKDKLDIHLYEIDHTRELDINDMNQQIDTGNSSRYASIHLQKNI